MKVGRRGWGGGRGIIQQTNATMQKHNLLVQGGQNVIAIDMDKKWSQSKIMYKTIIIITITTTTN